MQTVQQWIVHDTLAICTLLYWSTMTMYNSHRCTVWQAVLAGYMHAAYITSAGLPMAHCKCTHIWAGACMRKLKLKIDAAGELTSCQL